VACKSAETREQRTRLDLNRASHGEDLFTVAETQFGGNEQFVVSGEQLEASAGALDG
jgi:predicted ATPase